MKNKKVAILGKLTTKYKAPFDDKTFDIWCFNKHEDEENIPRVDLWFDIHKNKIFKPDAEMGRESINVDKLIELVGGNYFNNTVSYLIAYAILQGYEEIYLYGMRFNLDFEQRKKEYQNVRELIFFAKGKGLKLFAPYDEVMLEDYNLYK